MTRTWLAVALLAVATTALADETKQLNPQQRRMAECKKQAGDRKGDERKQFISHCLKN